jgi:hypothetical protein
VGQTIFPFTFPPLSFPARSELTWLSIGRDEHNNSTYEYEVPYP